MDARHFTRPLALVALAIVAGHVLSVVFLGESTLGSLIGNLLQIAASFMAATMCFRAARKVPGFSQSFWTLVGCGMGMWGLANIGWTYYEVVLHSQPPPGSMIRFLFDTHGMFFVMAIFLNQDKTTARVGKEEALDFVQIGILFFLIFFGMYYLPSLNLNPQAASQRELTVGIWSYSGIILLAVLQWQRGRLPEVRKLYGGLTLYEVIYTAGGITAEHIQLQHATPAGNWYDLAWTIPLLCGGFWAATWEPAARGRFVLERREESLTSILITNCMFAFLPLAILFLVVELGPGWKLLRFSLLGVSFACYALRIALKEFQQLKDEETVRRQTLAMDSSVDGIALIDQNGLHVYANSAFARMFGFEGPEQIVGQPWRVVFAFQDVNRLEPEIRGSLARAQRWSSPLLLKRRDGSRLPVELTVNAMPNGGTVCVCRDLSEREEAERARAEAEAKYRTLVE